MMLIKKNIKNIFLLSVFFLLACFITYPLIFNLTSITTGYGDEFFIAWAHNWNIHAILSDPLNIFNANIFFPYTNSLAFSEPFLTSSVLALIPLAIFKEPIIANNFTIILSLTLVGFFSYFLSHFLTKNNLISVFSGILVIFCPAYLSGLVHIQIIAIYFVILAIIFLLKFLQTKKTLYFILFLTSLVFQTYNSFTPAYFIVFSAFSICFFFVLEKRERVKIIFTKKNITLVLVSLFLIMLVATPYFKVSKEFNYVRDIRETIHFALQPEDFLVTSSYSRLQPLLSQIPFTKDLHGKGEVKPGFIGLAFSILVITSFLYIFKNWKKQNYVVKGLFSASILGLLLSLGPFLHLQRLTIHDPFPIPLPYALFYYIMPGFMGIRNSARFEMFFILFAAPIIAVFLKETLKNLKISKKYILLLSLALVVILEFNFPIKYYPLPQINEFPKVYSWLSTTPKSTVIVEMPIYNWNVQPYSSVEFRREYYSTAHFRKTVNGYSGFSPFAWQNFAHYLLSDFPSRESIAKLKKTGVNLIVVHKIEYDILNKDNIISQGKKIPSGEEVIKYLKQDKGVYFEKQFGDDYVFKIK